MKLLSRLFLLFLGVFLFSNALAYGFPIENRWKATVVGTPPGYRAELPESIALAIVAEIHACLNDRDGRSLDD